MNFAILRRPRTQALLDGIVEFAAPSILRWLAISDPLGWTLPPRERHRDLAAVDLDGGEMSVSSFVQAKSRGAPLVALPIFLKRGLVQRSLYCPLGSPLISPDQLVGKRVGMVSYTSSMAVWMRGVLNDAYGLDPTSIRWFTVTGSGDSAQALQIPNGFSAEKIQVWEELDGYSHELDRREGFLLTLLDQGALDAMVSFQARIACDRVRPLCENNLWSNPVNSRLYPINHLFVVKADLLEKFPQLAGSLSLGFREARRLWTDYRAPAEREAFENEMAKLGYDPFAYRLTDVEKTTLETFVGYLIKENLLPRKLTVDELFTAV